MQKERCAMLAAFGFEALGVVVGDMYFVDPAPNAGQETPERGVRLELRLVDRADPQGSIYAGIPIAFTRPVWRVDLFGSTESPPGTLDRAHHHPRFDGWEPGPRHFVDELSADPVSWLADQLADPAAVLARAGVGTDEFTKADAIGLAAAAPEIVAAVKRMLDGVRDGELAPASAEPVAAARTGWL
jgi:hypothetical protein